MNTKLSKSLVIPVAASAFSMLSVDSANAEIVLGGPGLPIGSYSLNQSQDSITVNLGEYYEYEVYGYYGRLDAGVPNDAWVDSTGKLYSDSTPVTYTGAKQEVFSSLLASVSVGSTSAGDPLQLVAGNVRETTGDVVVERASVLTLDEEDIKLVFQLDSNVTNPSGYLVVMGIGTKQPPKPTGELTVPNYARALTNPIIGWSISREGDSESQDNYDSTMTIELPDYDSDTTTDPETNDVPDTIDDGWKGDGKNNNGHGNNADGVDVSNPGKGKGGPNGTSDTDYDGDGTFEDDENSLGW